MSFFTWDFDGWVPAPSSAARAGGLRAQPGMAIDDDPTARVRERRFQALVSELMPKLRRLNPLWSDDEVLGAAESMAELRLLDEEIG